MSNLLKYTSDNDIRQRLSGTFIKVKGKAFFVRETGGSAISGYHADSKMIIYDPNKDEVEKNIPRIGYLDCRGKGIRLLVRHVSRSPIYSYTTNNSVLWNPYKDDVNNISRDDIIPILKAMDNPIKEQPVSLNKDIIISRDLVFLKKHETKYGFVFEKKNCLLTIDLEGRSFYYFMKDTPKHKLNKLFKLIPELATYRPIQL